MIEWICVTYLVRVAARLYGHRRVYRYLSTWSIVMNGKGDGLNGMIQAISRAEQYDGVTKGCKVEILGSVCKRRIPKASPSAA